VLVPERERRATSSSRTVYVTKPYSPVKLLGMIGGFLKEQG
jgi:hypothetical protein